MLYRPILEHCPLNNCKTSQVFEPLAGRLSLSHFVARLQWSSDSKCSIVEEDGYVLEVEGVQLDNHRVKLGMVLTTLIPAVTYHALVELHQPRFAVIVHNQDAFDHIGYQLLL